MRSSHDIRVRSNRLQLGWQQDTNDWPLKVTSRRVSSRELTEEEQRKKEGQIRRKLVKQATLQDRTVQLRRLFWIGVVIGVIEASDSGP